MEKFQNRKALRTTAVEWQKTQHPCTGLNLKEQGISRFYLPAWTPQSYRLHFRSMATGIVAFTILYLYHPFALATIDSNYSVSMDSLY